MTDAATSASTLGRYELLHELGYGGMASVHLARVVGPADFTKWLALKRIHPHLAKEQEFIDMFLDEARIAASLQHPHVAAVFELGQAGDEYFLAMEYLHGEHLGHVMRKVQADQSRLAPVLAARIVADAADGLHHAHEARDAEGKPMGLVHRDVSPQNIFITYDGHVKLTDFGIAKAADRLTVTATGQLKGKAAYMAPEQALVKPLDRRSDIFSLGVVLWEISVGRRLFKAESDVQTMMRITSGKVTKPSEKRDDFPPALEKIILRALSREPEDRYPTANAMARDLDRFIAESETPAGPSAIAHIMKKLFADKMSERDAVLRECAERPPITTAQTLPEDQANAEADESPVSRRMLLAGLGVVLAGAAIGFSQLPADRTVTSTRIITSPAGAEVWIDGQSVGRSPVTRDGLSSGRHELRVELEGYESLETTFDADLRDSAPLNYTLRPRNAVPVAIPSSGNEESELPAAEPEPVTMEITQMSPAQMRTTQMRRSPPSMATVSMGSVMEESVMENEVVGPPANLTVIALPWASVSVDGQRAQQTPLRGLRLSPGTHTLRYQVQGEGPSRTQQIRLDPGERRTLRLDTR